MHIGVVLPQTRWDQVIEAAQHAESAGADSVWAIDHVLGFPPPAGILEAWTVMSALATATSRVQIGAQVLCQSFRNPALLAKMTSTLDQISGGRFRLLIGTGWFQGEYDAFGWAFPSGGQRIEELRETLTILRGMLSSTEPFTFEGKHYRVKDVPNIPAPAHDIAIEVGGAGDRLLRTVAKQADGWNTPGAALSLLDDRLAFLAKACADEGRSVSDLVLSAQIVCAVGDDEARSHPRLAFFSPELGFVGSVDDATRRAQELVDKGLTGFHCVVPPGQAGRDCLERLINEVKPRVS